MLYMLYRIRFAILQILAGILIAGSATAITVATYNVPPFSMNEDGEDIGLATEVVQMLLRRAGVYDYTIIDYPLTRGLYELKYGRVDIYYPYVSKIATEEEKFVLIGPITKYKIALFVRKDYPQAVSFAAMQDSVVGAERGGISNSILLQHNIRVEPSTQEIGCLRMVLAERVTACAMGTLPGMYAATINNIYADLKYVETEAEADMYVALGASMPQAMITRIENAFEDLKQENYFETQQQNYEKKFSVFLKSLS